MVFVWLDGTMRRYDFIWRRREMKKKKTKKQNKGGIKKSSDNPKWSAI
jgi:hypothetical protein